MCLLFCIVAQLSKMSVVDTNENAWNNDSKLNDGYVMFLLSEVDVPNLVTYLYRTPMLSCMWFGMALRLDIRA